MTRNRDSSVATHERSLLVSPTERRHWMSVDGGLDFPLERKGRERAEKVFHFLAFCLELCVETTYFMNMPNTGLRRSRFEDSKFTFDVLDLAWTSPRRVYQENITKKISLGQMIKAKRIIIKEICRQSERKTAPNEKILLAEAGGLAEKCFLNWSRNERERKKKKARRSRRDAWSLSLLTL